MSLLNISEYLSAVVIVVVCGHCFWIRLPIPFLLWQLAWLLLIQQELILREKAFKSAPDEFLQVLCPKYMIASGIGYYLIFS